jgi:hypothetical protein
MAKSIISEEKQCYMCGSTQWIEVHHIFGGAFRNKSEQYGLKVPLCHYCHNEPPNGVHHNKQNRLALQSKAQEIAMEYYGWDIDEFRAIFGKNYIDEV